MARTKKSAIVESMATPAGDSPIAALPAHTDEATIRAARQPALQTGASVNFSGQYLYDRFVANDEAEVAKMDIVRMMVNQLDTASFKTCIKEFVAVAKGYADAAVKAAKENGTYSKENPIGDVAATLGRFKTAQNHQAVMRLAFGAIKHASDELAERGYTDRTGYQVMRVIAKAALEAKRINWDGTPVVAAKDKARREEDKARGSALAEVMVANKQRDDESRADYLVRVDNMATDLIQSKMAEHEREAVEKLVKKFKADAGPLLQEVIEALLAGDQEPQPASAAPAAVALH